MNIDLRKSEHRYIQSDQLNSSPSLIGISIKHDIGTPFPRRRVKMLIEGCFVLLNKSPGPLCRTFLLASNSKSLYGPSIKHASHKEALTQHRQERLSMACSAHCKISSL